jgi:ABC-type cobalamin/Fe3+-siderophores transport system ATPase subunit
VLDDPVQHIDDFRALHLVEVLSAIRQTGKQVICSVEDEDLAALLARRLRPNVVDDGGVLLLSRTADGAIVTRERPARMMNYILPVSTRIA